MDELYLLPRMELLVIQLGELGGVLQQAIEESSRSLSIEAVQFALASLWSQLPDFPVEEAMEGIVDRLEVEAHARTEAVAKAVVNTFTPVPAGGGTDPEARPEVPVKAAAAGQ